MRGTPVSASTLLLIATAVFESVVLPRGGESSPQCDAFASRDPRRPVVGVERATSSVSMAPRTTNDAPISRWNDSHHDAACALHPERARIAEGQTRRAERSERQPDDVQPGEGAHETLHRYPLQHRPEGHVDHTGREADADDDQNVDTHWRILVGRQSPSPTRSWLASWSWSPERWWRRSPVGFGARTVWFPHQRWCPRAT